MNSRRAQEEANVSSIGNGNANSILKLQAQPPRDNLNNPSSIIKDKPACDNRDSTNNSNNSSSTHDYLHDLSNFSTSDNGNLVYDPGRNGIDTKDNLTCNNSASASSCNVFPVMHRLCVFVSKCCCYLQGVIESTFRYKGRTVTLVQS